MQVKVKICYTIIVMDMKKNGFTIVELLVTIALLAIMSVVVGVSMAGMFERQNEKNLKEYTEKLENTACVYYETHPGMFKKEGSKYIISKDELINASLIDKDLESPEKIEAGKKEYVIVSTANYQRNCEYKIK